MPKKIKVSKKKEQEVGHETQEWKDKYLRALADYQNLEKRIQNQLTNNTEEARKKLLLKFLEVLDNIERAEAFVEDPGLALIKEQFAAILKDEGVSQMDIMNKPYDPHLAEAIDVVTGNDDNKVIQIVRKGYRIGDTVLRPAQVKVSKKIVQATTN